VLIGQQDASFYLFGSRSQQTGSVRSDVDILIFSESTSAAQAQVLWELEAYLDVFVAERGVARSLINGSTIRAADDEDLVQLLGAIQLTQAGAWMESAEGFRWQTVLADRNPAATDANLFELYDANPEAAADILVVTALTEEYRAVVDALEGTVSGPNQLLSVRDRHGAEWRVSVRNLNEMGSISAALETQWEILRSKARHVVLVGICAGIPSRSELLDVVLPSSIVYYESSKVTPGGIQAAPHVARCDDGIRTAISTMSDEAFKSSIEVGRIHAEGEVMGCGEKVVASAEFRRQLELQHRKLVAIDMESYGVVRAAAMSGRTATVIKAVCDMADEAKGNSHHAEARAAAARCFVGALRGGAFPL